ncbi:MAG: hypothetical protein SH868_07150 [Bythopirellula sp.]|nr:hypothetical protein [Bythopirellula sp.]
MKTLQSKSWHRRDHRDLGEKLETKVNFQDYISAPRAGQLHVGRSSGGQSVTRTAGTQEENFPDDIASQGLISLVL